MQSQATPQQTLKRARWWPRYWAFVFDGFFIGIIIFLFILPFTLFGININPDSEYSFIYSIITICVYFSYNIYYLSKRGYTYGKSSFGLKVIDKDTGNLATLDKIALREFLKTGVLFIPVLGQLFYLVNILVLIFTSNGLHERYSNTIVLKVDEKKPGLLTRLLVALMMLPLILGLIAAIVLFYVGYRYL